MPETGYWDRTDSFQEKLKLLEAACQRKDYRLVRALAHSIRNTAIQAQADEEPAPPPLDAPVQEVWSLPAGWREWAKGWSYFQVVALDETIGQNRPPEPVEINLTVPASQCASLMRELRVARVQGSELREVPSQAHKEVVRNNKRSAKLLFFASGPAHQRQTYLIFHGNPDAELPSYPTDLETRGEGFARRSRGRWGNSNG
jgi:hypothetical protein